ncbi:Eco57I restriction-modification methylase domain-containing protein [Emticicia oligotrophica]|uniref:Eco57I restriction-modification methylase domain-containing protein n=1 Tax=Emticicia oligotrophica TaxID=312279 RepID=UPI00273BE50B|nr:N-6 DNA methylase [Emticicia oligotrophica]
MNQKIFNYLKSYSYNVDEINKLLVSSFLVCNNIKSIQNEFLKKYVITKTEELVKLSEFIKLLEGIKFGLEELLELFEFVISPADKEVNGAVYTPKFIREYIITETLTKNHNLGKDLANTKIGDVACGCGGFFISIVPILRKSTSKTYFEIYKENIWGLDIQEYSIERTKIGLCLLAVLNGEDKQNFEFNLFQGNALNFEWKEIEMIKNNEGFDIILGNPPYVSASRIDNESKAYLKKWNVSDKGKADLYIPFFQIGLESLNPTGILGFLTVNTFYKSLNGRLIRQYFSTNKYDLKIIDFGGEQLFRKRSTYTCVCIIGKVQTATVKYLNTSSNKLLKTREKDFLQIKYEELNDSEGWYLIGKQKSLVISKIENTGIQLGNKYEIRNGFATLKNQIFIFKPVKTNEKYFIIEKDGKKFEIEKSICREVIKPNTLKFESELDEHIEQIIFPYRIYNETDLFEKNKRTIKIFEEDYFKEQFPAAYKYLSTYKPILSNRDKGEREYEQWFAFGRNQALTHFGNKLLFPYLASSPYFVFTNKKDLLFYNGYAIISDSKEELLILQKILLSNIFWYYIKSTSKPYSGSFFSLAKNYVKKFGVCELTNDERKFLLCCDDKTLINQFLSKKYNIPDKLLHE